MLFLSASEIFTNIVDGLGEIWAWVMALNWAEVWDYIKNIGLSGVALIAIRYGVPFLKGKTTNSKYQTLLDMVSALGETVNTVETENKTLKDGISLLLTNIQATAQVNATSKMLTADQQKMFLDIASKIEAFKPQLADKIEQAVSDGKITQDEALEIVEEASPELKQTLLTPINDLIPKSGEQG